MPTRNAAPQRFRFHTSDQKIMITIHGIALIGSSWGILATLIQSSFTLMVLVSWDLSSIWNACSRFNNARILCYPVESTDCSTQSLWTAIQGISHHITRWAQIVLVAGSGASVLGVDSVLQCDCDNSLRLAGAFSSSNHQIECKSVTIQSKG